MKFGCAICICLNSENLICRVRTSRNVSEGPFNFEITRVDCILCTLNIHSFFRPSPFIDDIPYFFGYKTEFFSFQNNPKALDPSCKTDLDLWDGLGRVKFLL